MSNEPTQAVQRAMVVLGNQDPGWTRDALAAELEVEEIAQELHRLFGLDIPWVKLSQTEKGYYRDKAADLRAAVVIGRAKDA